jgi:predicted metal-binding protein
MVNILDIKDDIINNIKNLGISAATIFPASEIKFDNMFRDMCKDNVCGRYGKNYKCPPAIGEPEDLKNEVLTYETVILIQTIYAIEDSYDFEGMRDGGEIHSENINKTIEYIKNNLTLEKILALGAGGCNLCPKCGIIGNIPCRFPDKAISSVEGYCMNVADMTTSHGLKYINGENTVSYVAVFLLK